ncbi:MAG: hypothetical protein ABI882_05420 [Acidobacteriota bacterium]
MASRAITRILLVLALIIAAHTLKPISSRSVVEQLLSAAESLSFVLPDIAEVRIAQASYLANAFGQRSGERREGDSRLTENELAVAVPTVVAFGQSMDSIGRISCDKAAAPSKVRQPMRARIKQLIPTLPEAMPLSRAMAMTLPLADVNKTLSLSDVELISMPVSHFSGRFIMRRALAQPTKTAKTAACESNVIVAEGEAELGQNEGPREEFEEIAFDPDLWDMTAPVEAVEASVNESTPTPAGRNCPVQLPEMIVPPLSVLGLPKE